MVNVRIWRVWLSEESVCSIMVGVWISLNKMVGVWISQNIMVGVWISHNIMVGTYTIWIFKFKTKIKKTKSQERSFFFRFTPHSPLVLSDATDGTDATDGYKPTWNGIGVREGYCDLGNETRQRIKTTDL